MLYTILAHVGSGELWKSLHKNVCGEADDFLCGFVVSFQLTNWAEHRNILSAKRNR
jgi:hypothetical protein